MKLLALDPGKTTGFATFDSFQNEKPYLERMGTLDENEIWNFLNTRQFDIYVVENYRIRTQKSARGFDHQWQSPFALEIIGAVKLRTIQLEAKFKLQEPSIKPVGYGYAKLPYKTGKANVHHLDAVAHGMFYLVKNDYLKPGELRGQASTSS